MFSFAFYHFKADINFNSDIMNIIKHVLVRAKK